MYFFRKHKLVKYATIFVFLLCGFTAADFTLMKKIPLLCDYFTTDNFGNTYAVQADVITKYDSKGDFVKTYNNKQFGLITSVDATNPMKPVLFYRNFLKVVFLDNTLSLNGEPISIEKLGFPQVQLVCSSYNNGLWMYDQGNLELIRLDQNFATSNKTGNLSQQLGLAMNPNFMLEYNNNLYVNNPATGILVFDVFGTYYKNIPITGLERFQFKDDELLYFKNGKFKSYQLKTIDEATAIIPSKNPTYVRAEKNTLFLQANDTLYLYSIGEK